MNKKAKNLIKILLISFFAGYGIISFSRGSGFWNYLNFIFVVPFVFWVRMEIIGFFKHKKEMKEVKNFLDGD